MTWGMFSVGWLELGNKEKGTSLFAKNFNYIQVNVVVVIVAVVDDVIVVAVVFKLTLMSNSGTI